MRAQDVGEMLLRGLPSEWRADRLKFHLERNDGGAWGDDADGNGDTVVLRSTEQTMDGRWSIDDPALRKLTTEERTATLLREGDLVLTKSSGSSLHIGKTTLVDSEVAALGCSYSNFMQRLRTGPSLNPKLAWYLLNHRLVREQFDVMSNSTTGLANLNAALVGSVVVPVPPIQTQVAIVAFLDGETGKIDALVEEQKRLIELLKEKRQAIISHAVTKGIGRDVRLKPTGVEWLGDVPEHWSTVRLAKLFRFIKRQNQDELEVLSVYRDYGVVQKASRDDNNNKTPEDLSKYQTVACGDLVVNKMKAWQGSLGVSSFVGITSPDYAVFEPCHDCSDDYLNRLLRSSVFPGVYRSISNGIRPDQWRLEPDKFRELLVPLPPHDEQLAISGYLSSSIEELDQLREEVEKAVLLLAERRSALILAAVTGKVDVSEVVQAERTAA